jgi:hypothetical protein
VCSRKLTGSVEELDTGSPSAVLISSELPFLPVPSIHRFFDKVDHGKAFNVYTATISGTWRMRSVGSELAREYTIQSEQEERLGGSGPWEFGVTDILVLQLGNASL